MVLMKLFPFVPNTQAIRTIKYFVKQGGDGEFSVQLCLSVYIQRLDNLCSPVPMVLVP